MGSPPLWRPNSGVPIPTGLANPSARSPLIVAGPLTSLRKRLDEPLAPARVLRGPRQVGKTTLQEQLIQALLERDPVDPQRLFRVQFDEIQTLRRIPDPILTLSRWFETRVLLTSFNAAAKAGTPAILFFDEVQNLRDWGTQIKALVDTSSVRVVVTGSSALRLQLGKDSLAGRLTSIEIGPLYLREIAGLRGLGELEPILPFNGPGPLGERGFWERLRDLPPQMREARDRAFRLFDEWGGYPLAHDHPGARWDEIAQQLRESIIQRAIQHDLRLGDRGRLRDERLLGEVFRLACRYAGQAPSPVRLAEELRETLPGDVGPQRIRHYLEALDSTLLLRLIPPLELRLKRRKGFPKIGLCDPALRAAYLQERVPLGTELPWSDQALRAQAGHVAESILGYFLAGIPGLELAWWPERPGEPEVDLVITVGTKRTPIEVKYTRTPDPVRDTEGLQAFPRKAANNASFGILVTPAELPAEALPPSVVAVPLSSVLLIR